MQFNVEGMSCAHCVQTVTKAVRTVDPAAKVDVDLPSGRVTVNGVDRRDAIAAAIEEAGYTVSAL